MSLGNNKIQRQRGVRQVQLVKACQTTRGSQTLVLGVVGIKLDALQLGLTLRRRKFARVHAQMALKGAGHNITLLLLELEPQRVQQPRQKVAWVALRREPKPLLAWEGRKKREMDKTEKTTGRETSAPGHV